MHVAIANTASGMEPAAVGSVMSATSVPIVAIGPIAESDEGCVWILQLRLAAFKPEIPPFLLKVINIIARRDDLGVIVGFLIKRRKHSRFMGRQRLNGFVANKPPG
jgi:hypothetical protein